jgi:hypothetical protein
MSRSYNKRGALCGGNDHHTVHRIVRAKQRVALHEAELQHNQENYDFNLGTKLEEFWNIWDCPRDGMRTAYYLNEQRRSTWADIHKCLNGGVSWTMGTRTKFIKDMKIYKKWGYIDSFEFLESQEILDYLAKGKDPLKRLVEIPSDMVERSIQKIYKHLLSK